MEHLQSETGLNGHSDFRFVVGQEVCNTDRITIFVFDKVHQHVVYLAKTKNDEVHVQKEYDYIKDFYGKDNCKKPVDAKLSTYQ